MQSDKELRNYKILYWNFRSIKQRKLELEHMVQDYDITRSFSAQVRTNCNNY